jgi:hypothetical protein
MRTPLQGASIDQRRPAPQLRIAGTEPPLNRRLVRASHGAVVSEYHERRPLVDLVCSRMAQDKLSLFGARVPFIHESGWLGLAVSLVIVGIAAFNLLIDFAVIEEGVRNGSPRYMEWYCGMALLVTLAWLYLELLRLLSKLRGKS